MSLKQDLKELVENRIIDISTAQKIETYYQQKAGDKSSRLLSIFALLGVILIGAGILLIVANNWNNFSAGFKTFLSFLPLVLAQLGGWYVLQYKNESLAWRESIAWAISFGLIIALTLTSQIYQMEETSSYLLLSWIALSLPLVYIFKAKSLGLFLYLLSIVYLFKDPTPNHKYIYLLLLLLLTPFYFWKLKGSKSHLEYIYRWVIAWAFFLFVLAFFQHHISLLILAGLFSVFYYIGAFQISEKSFLKNPFLWGGITGLTALFIAGGFESYWSKSEQLFLMNKDLGEEFVLALIFLLINLFLWIKYKTNEKELPCFHFLYFLFVFLYIMSFYFEYVYIISNIIVLCLGILLIFRGEKFKRLDILNAGLLSILILIITHFFSNDIPFIYRGLAFVLTGLVFIGINIYLYKNFTDETH